MQATIYIPAEAAIDFVMIRTPRWVTVSKPAYALALMVLESSVEGDGLVYEANGKITYNSLILDSFCLNFDWEAYDEAQRA